MKSYEKFSDRVNPDHDKEFDSRVSNIATGIISEYSPINNDVADCFEKYIAEIRPDH